MRMTNRTQHPTKISQERRVQAPTFTCGSSLRNCCPVPKRTDRVSDGWTVPKAFSKSRIPLKWPDYGANVKTDRLWTTTSWADRSDSTTKRALWKKRNDLNVSSISSVTRTICKDGGWRVKRSDQGSIIVGHVISLPFYFWQCILLPETVLLAQFYLVFHIIRYRGNYIWWRD